MTPIYPEGFIQIVPFAPFAAEIFNLMGTACRRCVQCSLKQCPLPDWVTWPEVGVSQLLIVWCINIPEQYIPSVHCSWMGHHILVFCLNIWDSDPIALSRPGDIAVHQLIQLLRPVNFVSLTFQLEQSWKIRRHLGSKSRPPLRMQSCFASHLPKCLNLPQPGPDGYPRVLDYSTFEFTTLPYSKNFTTRSSSRVVTISSFCPIIQIFGMGRHHSFLDNGRHVSNDVVAWSIRFRLHYSHRYIG